jgi:hypothetical protein
VAKIFQKYLYLFMDDLWEEFSYQHFRLGVFAFYVAHPDSG